MLIPYFLFMALLMGTLVFWLILALRQDAPPDADQDKKKKTRKRSRWK